MRFICLKYLNRLVWNACSADERQTFATACAAYDDKLRQAGHFFAAEALQTVGAAVGLRTSNGQLLVEDEASRQGRDQLGGLMFLEARDLNHAIVLVSDHPAVRIGWFEIHPADS